MINEKELLLSSEIVTPAYFFDLDELLERVQVVRAKLPSSVQLCYAMKANPFIIGPICDFVDHFEVCSPGEFRICELSKIPMEKVIVSGVYKEEENIESIVETYHDTVTYTVESINQWDMIRRLSIKHNVKLRLLLRITSGNQFGMEPCSILEFLDTNSNERFNIIGIQYFSGTMKASVNKYRRDLIKITDMISILEKSYNLKDLTIEYGPGLPIDYFGDNDTLEMTMLHELNDSLLDLKSNRRITLEMGRFLTASCGSYLTTVVDKKHVSLSNYCIVDGGIHHINYFGQNMAMKIPPIKQIKESGISESWTIFGALCTTNDILARNVHLRSLEIGDRLLFKKTGAYSMTEGISLFLSRSLPQVYFISKNDGLRVVRQNVETYPLNYVKREVV